MAIVYLGLGSNLGDKKLNLKRAIEKINGQIGNIIDLSAYYYSAPLGFESSNDFVNLVLSLESNLDPTEVLVKTQKIECELGRKSKSLNNKYTDRLIDIDILFYNSLIINNSCLQIPHPKLHERAFVINPLAEIAPTFIHPTLNKSLAELACIKEDL